MRRRDEGGQSAGPEMMVLLVFALAAWAALAWLGRLNSTAQDLVNTAQAAARAASLAADPAAARTAAGRVASGSNLPQPCAAAPSVSMSWRAGPTGTWRGGSVTVTLQCTVDNREPLGAAGRTMTASDTQVVERYSS